MTRLEVRSREYKVMLQPERFGGDEREVRGVVDRFWADVTRALEPLDIPTKGAFDEVKAHRRIRFFDTTAKGFNNQRYVFRERVDVEADFSRVGQEAESFPGLDLHDVDEDAELTNVGGFCARELVLVGATLLLGKHDVEAECAMVMWHDDDDVATPPVCVEFSFKYGDDEEDYRGSVTRDAHDVLDALHGELADWVHPEPKTKTAFVYG